jgi:hypothetical protein
MARGQDILQAPLAASPVEDASPTPCAGTIRIAVAQQLGRIASRQRDLAQGVAQPELRSRFLASAERLEALVRTSAQEPRDS